MRANFSWMFLQATETAAQGYTAALLQALIALGAISLIAWVVLRAVTAQRFGPTQGLGHVRVLDRIALDARRSLYLVRVGTRVLLLGGGDGAAPSLLAELDPEEVAGLPERRTAFDVLLQRFARAKDASPAAAPGSGEEKVESPPETSVDRGRHDS